MRPEIVFVDNIGYANCGDQLMVMAVIEQVEKSFPGARIFVHECIFYPNASYFLGKGIYPLQFPGPVKSLRPYRKMLNFLLRKRKYVIPSEVDLVLNCRGYYLSDYWCYPGMDREEIAYNAHFKNPRTKFIYLPQAFGPFESETIKFVMSTLYERASMIYARDRVSYGYLTGLFPDAEKIRIAPDFTCLHHPQQPCSIQLPPKQYVALILNARMTDKTSAEVSEAYLTFMRTICMHLLSKDENVILLNHEGEQDYLMISDFNRMLPKPLPVYTNLNGDDLKSIIASAKLVITSRYHGAVSALTQGVPVLCTGWSHKYRGLLEEHQCTESLIDVLDTTSAIQKIDAALSSPLDYCSKEGCTLSVENKVRQMWDEIVHSL